nr:hypothetical protein CFP56_36252 [Quercus suber]
MLAQSTLPMEFLPPDVDVGEMALSSYPTCILVELNLRGSRSRDLAVPSSRRREGQDETVFGAEADATERHTLSPIVGSAQNECTGAESRMMIRLRREMVHGNFWR